jgi:hypothetical protein
MDPSSARITVVRTHPDDVRTRQIIVSADGEHLGELLYGESLTKEIAPGRHRLRAHNTLFWKTHEVDLRAGEEARFVVVNRAGTGTFSLLSLLGVGPLYLTFERESSGTSQPSKT